jgi:anti-sigma factor ChrR (cupin superfamily)
MNDPLVFSSLLARAQAQDLAWRPFRPGVDIVTLYGVVGETRAAALLRYEAGAVIPRHDHSGLEHILVLQGSQEDDRGVYPMGTLVVRGTGMSHTVKSPEGCVVLAMWDAPVTFLAPDSAPDSAPDVVPDLAPEPTEP